MFKRIDYIVIFFLCIFLGIFIVSQVYAKKEYEKIIQPENNDILAIEVSRLTKSNADLRTEVKSLTDNLDNYRKSNTSRKDIFDQFTSDQSRLDLINGDMTYSGQGVDIKAEGGLNLPQVVDLVNAIKNIGGELIVVDGKRITLATDMSSFVGKNPLEIKVIGNSRLLKSSLERKGGIVEQLSDGKIKFTIDEKESVDIPTTTSASSFKYAKVLAN